MKSTRSWPIKCVPPSINTMPDLFFEPVRNWYSMVEMSFYTHCTHLILQLLLIVYLLAVCYISYNIYRYWQSLLNYALQASSTKLDIEFRKVLFLVGPIKNSNRWKASEFGQSKGLVFHQDIARSQVTLKTQQILINVLLHMI